MAKLSDIAGIGEGYAVKLKGAKISTLEALLACCCKKKNRKDISQQTGIKEALILNWVNRADLARISGIGKKFGDLLEAAGVDSVPELAQRNPQNLHSALAAANDKMAAVDRVPSMAEVQSWVKQAKVLPKVVTH